jgi:crossover junction endodeoxyribonuclease RuvC
MVWNGQAEFTHTVKSAGKKDDNLYRRQCRLSELVSQILNTVIDDDGLDLAVIENPSYGSKFGSPHDRSGLWWMVVDGLISNSIAVATVSPQGRAKYGTGSGGAKKPAVYAAAKATYEPLDFDIPNNDVADAVILASMGSRYLDWPLADIRPDNPIDIKKLEAMGGAAWPA